MGMFDYVQCDAKLPNPEPMDSDYQTKCMDCLLDEYTISSENKLFVSGEQICFDGEMYFYGTTKQTGRWKEYKASFEDGVMVAVEELKNDQ